MKEWQRTIILLTLLAVAVIFVVWLRSNYDNQALQSLR